MKTQYTYQNQFAVNKRTVTYNNHTTIVFDVWSMLNGQWKLRANAMSLRLIKEFFNIDVIA